MTITDKETKARLSQLVKYNKPIGTGRGYRLSDEKKQQIYDMYFNESYGMRVIAHNLGISLSAVRSNIYKFKDLES
tara:strand:- start:530 stop:757 length:228 start_codon:yes stop_codon:yes gene_type:complete